MRTPRALHSMESQSTSPNKSSTPSTPVTPILISFIPPSPLVPRPDEDALVLYLLIRPERSRNGRYREGLKGDYNAEFELELQSVGVEGGRVNDWIDG
jgi:hypothetical protein